MFHTMKRGFSSEVVVDHNIALANCLMFLSQGRRISYDIPGFINNASSTAEEISHGNIHPSRVFECKTCNRQFPSFQALGGHRASHKRPKSAEDHPHHGAAAEDESAPAKAKTHECSICGLEFAIGQALGGHMRRHRSADQGAAAGLNRSSDHQIISLVDDHQAPIVKKSNTSTITKVFSFDLNLTPMENVDLHLGKPAPVTTTLDCYL